MGGLESTIAELEQARIEGDLWVDGGFLTESENPADVDVVLKVAANFYTGATEAQRQKLQWFESGEPKSSYKCDSYKWIEWPQGHALYWQSEWDRAYWIRQYGFSRGLDYKGIAVVRVGGG